MLMSLDLKIVSPAKVEYTGNVERVVVPGMSGMFEILTDHAPIISALEPGTVAYTDAEGEHDMKVASGFVEVQKNKVTVCVEF